MVKSIRYVRKEYCFQERLVSANFKKEAIPKPARIPPQTPPARGRDRISKNISRILRILFPRKYVSQKFVLFRFLHQDCFQNKFEFCTIETAKKIINVYCFLYEKMVLCCTDKAPRKNCRTDSFSRDKK